MSYGSTSCSSMTRSRKGSWLISKIDENEVDREVEEVMENYRSQKGGKTERIKEVEHALEFCREQLKDLLNDEAAEKNGKTRPIDIQPVDTHGNLASFVDLEKVARKKQMYFDKIVHLGLERQKIHESDDEICVESQILRAQGHEFQTQPIRGRHNPCCEVCMHTIWRLVQQWRRCRVCGMRAHDKCAEEVRRVCAGCDVDASTGFQLRLTICEESSLAEQAYQCAECSAPISFDGRGGADQEARLCDYSGALFCPNCHWNDMWSIPARIVHNLDATPRPVSRRVKQILSIVENRPLIDINESSLSLIKFHKQLRRVAELRRNFLLMKCYFVSCRVAKKLRILQYLKDHSHFVDSASTYSLRELRELLDGTLLDELEQIHTVFRKHIEEECEVCRGNAFYCELCNDERVLYAFTEATRSCSKCLAVYHRKCFEKRSLQCPRCERRRKRDEHRADPSSETSPN